MLVRTLIYPSELSVAAVQARRNSGNEATKLGLQKLMQMLRRLIIFSSLIQRICKKVTTYR